MKEKNNQGQLKEIQRLKLEADAIEEIKERYRTTFNSIGDGVITTGKDGRITNMNPAAEHYCGWTVEEAANRPFSEVFRIVNAKTRKKVADPVKKVLKSKKVVGLANHTVLISKSGKEYQIADTAAPIKSQDGELTGVVLVFSDVTEKYKAEKLLEKTKERYRIISETTSDFAFSCIKRKKGYEMDWMAGAVKRITGYSVEEVRAKKCWRFMVHPDDDPIFVEHVLSLKPGEESACELRIFDPKGAVKWLSVNTICLWDEEKKQHKIYGGCEDITERRQTEEALRKSEEQHRRLFETMSQGVVYQSADGTILSANPAAERMLGLSMDQMRGKTSMDPRWKMITEDGEKVPGKDHPVMTALRTGEKVGPVTRGIYIPEKDEYVWLSLTATPLFRPGEDKPFQSYAVFDDITFRKKQEDEIKKQQQLIQTILSKLPIGIAINTIGSEPKVELINENFARIYGVKTEDLPTVGSFWEAVYEDETFREEIKSRTLSDINSGDPKRMHWQDIPITKNGKIVKYVSAQNILLEEEALMISTVMDTTERKMSEQALKASETKFRSLFEEANDAILIMQDKVFIDCNSKAEEAYGCKKEQIIGKTPVDFSPALQPDGGNSAAMAKERIKAALSGENQFFEWHHKRFDGSLFDAEISLSAFQINDKSFTQAIVRDITERKESERTKQVLYQIANEVLLNFKLDDFIRAVEIQLSQIVDTTNFYIALYDPESGMLSAPFEKDQKDSIESWPAQDSATGLVIEKKQSVLLNKQDVLNLIESGEIKQTGSICESWLGVPLFRGTDVSGVIVVQSYDDPEAFNSGTIEVFEYVSNQISLALERTRIFEDLVQAKNRAEESDRLKSAFLANMSHEIRTPMNGILGFSQLLKEPGLSGEEQQQYIEIIQKSGDRMLNIINDIVDISRIESGLMDVTLQESNINEQLDYIYTFFKPQVQAKGLKFLLPDMLPSEKAIVITDREKLFAVLTNLVKNAIKYTHEGTIGFGCNKKGSTLEFFVRDTGIGIPKDRQQAIFGRFIQADIEDKDARQGAGLGLAISKAYVEMLGGEIWVQSEEGKGSAFYFTIPGEVREKGSPTPGQKAGPAANEPAAQKLKILVVEDDELSALLIKKYVAGFALDVLQAYNGKDAVEICRQHQDIDVILMDIKMPVMEGDEAAREIRRFNGDVVIIAQTAKALSGDRANIMEAGFNDYITKPINRAELLQCIKQHLL